MKNNFIRYYISFETLLMREIRRFMRIGVQTLLAPFISNILFLGIFAGLYYGDISRRSAYLHFITPGLITSAVIFSAYQNPVFSIVALKYLDTIKDFNYYPLKPFARMGAFVLAGAIRGILVGFMTYLAAAVFAGFRIDNPLQFWAFAFAVSAVFSTAGYLSGLYLSSFEMSNLIVSLVLTPLVYLGGVFFDTAILPQWLQAADSVNPLSAIIVISRHLYSASGILPHTHSVILLVAATGALFFAAYRATLKGIGIKI